jgi:FAD/FMN-containing dehydrogenase
MSEYRPNREPLVAPGQIDHHVADFTATVAVDVSLQTLQRTLADKGQWIPIDGDADQPIGQLVQTNSTGPLRLGYGAWRDLLLGAQFINGRDELITAGGRTVKNVAGYDLTKFMVGQRGIFGKLVTVTTRTYKRPAGAILATFDPSAGLMQQLIPSAMKPQWSLLTDEKLLCGYMGDERALAYYSEALKRLSPSPRSIEARSLEQDIGDRARLWKGEFRVSVPPARVEEFIHAARLGKWVADPAFGIILGEGDEATIRGAVKEFGGTVVFLRQGQTSDADWFDVPPGAQRELLERLKQSFDPENRLAALPWKLQPETSAT